MQMMCQPFMTWKGKTPPTAARPYQLSPKTPRPSFVYGEPPLLFPEPARDEKKSREDGPTELQRKNSK
jgi:hypothetical protein